MDNFKVIYRILRYLEKAMDYDEVDIDFISASVLKVSEQRWTAIMEMLVKEGYIEGVSITRSCDGSALLSIGSPRITLRGLEYLNENSLVRKAANAAKGIAELLP